MKFDEAKKKQFVEKDLYHELRCLIGAREFWELLKEIETGFGVIVAMDASMLHIRNLINFFSQGGKNDITVEDYGAYLYPSIIADDWTKVINGYMTHISKMRLKEGNNIREEGRLSEQVNLFTNEVLRLWQQFENDPMTSKYHELITDARKRAHIDLTNDQNGYIANIKNKYEPRRDR